MCVVVGILGRKSKRQREKKNEKGFGMVSLSVALGRCPGRFR